MLLVKPCGIAVMDVNGGFSKSKAVAALVLTLKIPVSDSLLLVRSEIHAVVHSALSALALQSSPSQNGSSPSAGHSFLHWQSLWRPWIQLLDLQ